ncbi:hypothetical protein MSHRCOH1_03760 [Candidatus Ornithobacterium hominis]|uniref:hypothetical protein n=1 Tax=Candidatus Ornithobacterium hominis TaxID=2497989 RepID=UPI0024BCE1FA|nr:hypothetical protein [Candidatus Ornithobacterium hominis]CAI9429306.1 hypothetical protein MSHRCOH1_03760 [Candidatus Ornithobacterium hominis]
MKKIKATYFKQIDDRLFVLESDSSPLYVYNNCIHFHLIKKVGHNYGGGLYRINDNIVDMSFNGLNIDSLDKISFFMTNEFYFNNMNKRYLIVNKLLREFKAEHYLIEIYNFEIVKKIHYKGTIRLFTQSNNIITTIKRSRVGPWPPKAPEFMGGADQIIISKYNFPENVWVESIKDYKTGTIYSYGDFCKKFPNLCVRK